MEGFARWVRAYERHENIFYMDETVFSTGQVKPKIWYCAQSGPVLLPKKRVAFRAIAVAAAIDRRGRVVAHYIKEKSIDTEAFCSFLRKLKQHTKRRKAVLLCDNLRVHRTGPVRELAARLNIEIVYNGTYSSE